MTAGSSKSSEERQISSKAADEPRSLILLGEDSPEIRVIMLRTLENEGCDCMIASNGHEIITMAQKYRPEVIMLDLLLPGINGFQVLLRLRNQGYTGKVCIVSVMDDAETVQKALDFGALDYLVKPIFPEMLVHKVNLLLDRIDRIREQPSVSSQLSGQLNREGSAYQCSITRLSDVQVMARCFEQFRKDEILFLESAALDEILDRTEPVAVRVVGQDNDQVTLELVGISDRSRRRLQAVMQRGEYLADYDFFHSQPP